MVNLRLNRCFLIALLFCIILETTQLSQEHFLLNLFENHRLMFESFAKEWK